ncbi:MAG TPA: hypothetical protein VEW68_03130 [Patescibacteria group bacterium]|nr:hypothetical protein [Patescibacteria group bacterium]
MPGAERPPADPTDKGRLLTVGPSTQRLLVYLGPIALAMPILGGIVLARHRTVSEMWLGIAFIVAAVAVVAFILVWSLRTRMFVSANEVGYVDFLGRSTVFPLKDVRRVIDRQVIMGGRRPSSMVYLLGAGNRIMFQLNRRIWGSGLDQLLKQTGRKIERDVTPIRAADLMRQLQGSSKT